MKAWIFAIAVVLSSASWADDTTAPRASLIERVIDADSLAPAVKAGGALRFQARRYTSSKASAAAYQRVDAALNELARSRGLFVAEAEDNTAAVVEVDSTFYVYTNKFNAAVLRLPEYTEAQLKGRTDGTADAQEQPKAVDALRIVAGAVGIVSGWISPSFGSYMISSGAAPALFGSGKAPIRLFVAGKERYERGEQEVNTRVRLLRNGTLVGEGKVRCWTAGDESPFRIDTLVADNWSNVMDVLGGERVVSTEGEQK